MEDVEKVETWTQRAVVVYPPHSEQEEMIGCSMHIKHILSMKVFILKTDKTILRLKQKLEAGPSNKAGILLFSGTVS